MNYKMFLIASILSLFSWQSLYATSHSAQTTWHDRAKVNLKKFKDDSVKKISQMKESSEDALYSLKQSSEQQLDKALDALTPDQRSALEDRLAKQRQSNLNPLSIVLFRPNYVLPFYYTGSPYQEIYTANTPNEQRIMNAELKAHLSLLVPVVPRLFSDMNSINVAYTQLSYWQVYAESQYFRETNYEPELFFESHFHRNWLFRAGLNHQSNGRGGLLERSWNRAFGTLQLSGEKWLISLKLWDLIFKNVSSNLHNPDIAHYLGYEHLLFSYKIYNTTFSLELQNIESGLKRGSVQVSISHPIWQRLSIYGQYFSGFGQSLIEYNHRTQSAGIGLAFNDWM